MLVFYFGLILVFYSILIVNDLLFILFCILSWGRQWNLPLFEVPGPWSRIVLQTHRLWTERQVRQQGSEHFSGWAEEMEKWRVMKGRSCLFCTIFDIYSISMIMDYHGSSNKNWLIYRYFCFWFSFLDTTHRVDGRTVAGRFSATCFGCFNMSTMNDRWFMARYTSPWMTLNDLMPFKSTLHVWPAFNQFPSSP